MTLRLVAQYADLWNGGFGSPELFRHKCAVLEQWCTTVGRDPTTIERTVSLRPADDATYDHCVTAGAQHIILMIDSPWDLTPVERLVRWRDARL